MFGEDIADLRGSSIVDVQMDSRIEMQDWHGSVVQRDTLGQDTGCFRKGEELDGQVHASLKKNLGPIQGVADILLAGIIYGNRPDAIIDAGFSFLWNLNNFEADLHFGQETSRPDIRGLPDSLFRQRHLHAYLASLPLSYRGEFVTRIGIQPYIRFQDKCPQMTPLLNVWDTSKTTSLFARGVDLDAEIRPLQWATVHGSLNLAWAQRSSLHNDSLYEWEIPWTFRCGVHLSFLEERVHVYGDYVLTSGLPYYNFPANEYQALPDYGRVDISLQYRTEPKNNRLLTRYDCYCNVNNLLDQLTVRDYYWNEQMGQVPIFFSRFSIDFGVRLGFRL